MAALSDVQARCVIWFGQPKAVERAALAAAGWQIRVIDPAHPGPVGLRGRDQLVVIIDLRQLQAECHAALQAWIQQHDHLATLAAMPSPGIGAEASGSALADACGARYALPLELPLLLAELGRHADPANTPAATPCFMLGESPCLLASRAALHKFAAVDLPVLVTGETGTGKELAANALHALSARRARGFHPLNCGAIPSSLVQSELFGHERGAFTGAAQRRLGLFETANGGTVFLDEIGDLPLDAQTSLLRVLQEGTLERVGSSQPIKVDVRVIAATHVDLERAVEQGRFRRDLFYRLNVLRLPLPALRERGDDVLLLADHFLRQFREQHRGRARGFSAGARRALQAFTWPGNVRELVNRVQRAAVVAEGELIEAVELELTDTTSESTPRQLQQARGQLERELLIRSLQAHHFNVSACARDMQVSRITIYRLCRRHGVALPEQR